MSCGKCVMANQASSPERDVYELMKSLPNKHEKSISGHDLKAMLKWVQVDMPAVTASTIFARELQNNTGVKLWDSVTKGNTESHRLLSSWRVIFETMKAQEEKAEEGEEEESHALYQPLSHSALNPWVSMQLSIRQRKIPLTQDWQTLKKDLIYTLLIHAICGQK